VLIEIMEKQKAGSNMTMESLSIDDRDYALWLVIQRAMRYTFEAMGREMSLYGITPEQGDVLFILNTLNGKLTLLEIARLTCRQSQSVLALINRMEKKGLVRKARGLQKRSSISVVLTEKGRQVYESSSKREAIHNIMSILSEEERHQLASCMNRLSDKALGDLVNGTELKRELFA